MVGYFTAANRIGTLAIVEMAEQACSMVLTISLLHFWAGEDSVRACEAVVLGGGFSGCVTLLCLVVLRKKEKTAFCDRIPLRKRLCETAVPLALADDLKSGISTAENLMVPKRLSLCTKVGDHLAAFGIVCGMVFPVLMFPMAILYGLAELLIPELARCSAAGSNDRIRYLARRSLKLAVLYGCLFCGTLFLLSEDICLRLYDNRDAVVYLRRFSLLVPMLYCDAITDAMIKGLGQQTACVRYNILTTALDVLLLFVLLPKYGMEGYYFSFLLTHLLNFILSLRRLLRLTGKLFSPAIPVLTLSATAVSVMLAKTLPNALWQCGVYLMLLGCLLFLLRVVSMEDIIWIKGLIHKKKALPSDIC